MILLRILLFPFTIVYSAVIFIRNKLYDSGIFRSIKVSKPVISVGNISTGGTGKTPFTIFTAKYFLDKGKSVGIISRGYKRKSEGLFIVCDGKEIIDSADLAGDEPAMIANALSGHKSKLFIAVSSDRTLAANFIIENFNPDVLILDDGFQHRKIKRDLDIVIADSGSILKDDFLNSFTLPSGILRENPKAMKRADLIIQNNKDKEMDLLPCLKKFNEDIVLIRYKTEYLIDNKNIILETDSHKINAEVFSGLANDVSFIDMINGKNIKILEKICFKDHHDYSADDIQFLKDKFVKDSIFITTEKDFIKIKRFTDFTEHYPVFYLKIGIIIEKNAGILYKNFDKLLN